VSNILAQYKNGKVNGCDTCECAPSLYVNYFRLGHNPFEFLFDLGQYRPEPEDDCNDISFHTRLALPPAYAKLLAQLLTKAVCDYEQEIGKIPEISGPANPFEQVLSTLPDISERAREILNSTAAKDGMRKRKPPETLTQ
jgi:hypothetical protein